MAPLRVQPKQPRRPPPRPASFHGLEATTKSEPRQMRRPKTQPDLLAACRRLSPPATPASVVASMEQKRSSKVLVNVTVQRSIGPVQVLASADWTVHDLAAAAVRVYVQEERRPSLHSADPAAFGLHYSQFSLEILDSQEKLINLGSRNFFLCQKVPAASAGAASGCWGEAGIERRFGIQWLRFMDCLLSTS